MAKIENDKYYTSIELANYCWDKVIEIIGEENISEIIEPSCGNGAFYHHDKLTPHFGYDIEPEFEHKGIIKGNFLEQNINYLYGRLSIGNVPYGTKMNLARSFYNKCVDIGDYIAFILPISQLNNTQSLYKFDLVYSEDLGNRLYSDREVHCCFNIYKRPRGGVNTKINYKNSLIDIIETRESIKTSNPRKNKDILDFDYDIRMIAWGDVGRFLTKTDKRYAKEFYIKINDLKNKDKIISLLQNANWKKLYPMTVTPNLLQWQVYKYIGENINKLNIKEK